MYSTVYDDGEPAFPGMHSLAGLLGLRAFLSRVMHNPEFIRQLFSQSEMRKELEEFVTIKSRRRIDQGPELDSMGTGSSPEQVS
ncbi:hypothetical protein NK662_23200, partial [Ectobacillus sp. SYSU M60031]|nr:hypothetical protein [Ectobacillus ponti]